MSVDLANERLMNFDPVNVEGFYRGSVYVALFVPSNYHANLNNVHPRFLSHRKTQYPGMKGYCATGSLSVPCYARITRVNVESREEIANREGGGSLPRV